MEAVKKKINMSSEDEEMKKCIIGSFIWVLILTSIALIIALIATSAHQISSTEVAVGYKTVEAQLGSTILYPGLNWLTPFTETIRIPTVYQTLETKLDCNSNDGVKINIDVSFQFVPKIDDIFELITEYKNFETYVPVVESVSRASIRHTCSEFTAEEYQTKRSEINRRMEEDLVNKTSEIYSNVLEFQLRNIERGTYEDAVEDTETAKSEIDIAQNERRQKLVEATTELEESKQTRNQIIDTANTAAEVETEKANVLAKSIKQFYDAEANVLKVIKDSNKFTNAELLEYLADQVFVSGKMLVKSADVSL